MIKGLSQRSNFLDDLDKAHDWLVERYSEEMGGYEAIPVMRVWETYHLPEMVEEYGIKKTDIVQPYYANDFSLTTPNVNELNPFWSELVTLWHVWKADQCSRYVGFQHYRRRFSKFSVPADGEALIMKFLWFNCERQDDGGRRIQICQEDDERSAAPDGSNPMTVYDQFVWVHGNKYIDLAIDILSRDSSNEKYVSYLKESYVLVPWCSFIVSWDNFTELARWLFNIIGVMMAELHISWTASACEEHFKKEFGNNRWMWRMFSFIGERLIGAWLHTNLKCVAVNAGETNSMIFSKNYYYDGEKK